MSNYSNKMYAFIIAVMCMLTLSACESIIGNPADVNVVNNPNVIVDNTPDNPIPIQINKPARTPVSKTLQIVIGENEHSGRGVFDSLPDSGILVIEQIGYGVSGHYNCRTANFKLITSLPGSMNTSIHLGRTMTEHANGNGPHDSFAVRIYHDLSLGQPLEVVYARLPGGQTAYVNISFSGYIVPAGSASLAP